MKFKLKMARKGKEEEILEGSKLKIQDSCLSLIKLGRCTTMMHLNCGSVQSTESEPPDLTKPVLLVLLAKCWE